MFVDDSRMLQHVDMMQIRLASESKPLWVTQLI